MTLVFEKSSEVNFKKQAFARSGSSKNNANMVAGDNCHLSPFIGMSTPKKEYSGFSECHRKITNLTISILADVCEMIPGLCLNGKCINLRGGHRCMCNVGYKLTMDGKRCLGEKFVSSVLLLKRC